MDAPHIPVWKERLFALLIPLAAAAFIAVTAWQLVIAGPFAWHVTTARSWQGAAEGMVLAALLASGLSRNSTLSLLMLVLLPALFYLRRHAIDLPLVIDGIYIESIVALGNIGRRCCGAAPAATTSEFLCAFVFGLCLWSIAAWTASAFGFGRVTDLRWLTIALAAIAFAGRTRPFAVHLWQRLRASKRSDRTASGVLLAWCLVLYAKAGLAEPFDSLWYPLRPEYVLVADGSAFRPLGLVAPVHYFPKLYEMLLVPLAGLGNLAVMNGLGIWLLLMIGTACIELFRDLHVAATTRRIGVALCVTLPAVCNIASSEAKPDTLALLMMLLALAECIRYARERDARHLVCFATCALLATQIKLTAIPYVGALGLVLAATVWQKRDEPSSGAASEPRAPVLAAFGCALIVAAFVTARTWLLTGMPTVGPDPLFALWRAVGMTLTAPVGTLQWTRAQIWSDVPLLLLDELFRPQKLDHIVISWLGNAWLLFAAVAGAAAYFWRPPRPVGRASWFGFALMTTGFALLVGCRYHERGSDGNYFAVAALAATIFSVTAAFGRVAGRPLAKRALVASSIALALFQAEYAFVSAAWNPGTRTFDFDLTRGFHAYRQQQRLEFEQAGLAAIAERLRGAQHAPRVIGYLSSDTLGFKLPCTFEDLKMISFSHPEYFASAYAFTGFLRAAHIDAIILPRKDAPPSARENMRALAALLPAIESLPDVRRFDDRSYTLLDLSKSLGKAPTPLAERSAPAMQTSCATQAAGRADALTHCSADADEMATLDPGEIDERRHDEPERQRRAEEAIAARERHEQQQADADR
jgi:hypothetical protein